MSHVKAWWLMILIALAGLSPMSKAQALWDGFTQVPAIIQPDGSALTCRPGDGVPKLLLGSPEGCFSSNLRNGYPAIKVSGMQELLDLHIPAAQDRRYVAVGPLPVTFGKNGSIVDTQSVFIAFKIVRAK